MQNVGTRGKKILISGAVDFMSPGRTVGNSNRKKTWIELQVGTFTDFSLGVLFSFSNGRQFQ